MNPLSKQRYDIQYRKRNALAVQKYRQEKRDRLLQLKNKPCMDCGGWFNPWQMEFDHRDPATKLHTVSKMAGFKLKTLWEEIQKCDVMCANCHAERTHKQILNKAFKFGGQVRVQ